MVKRKPDSAVDNLQWIGKFVNPTRLYVTCEKSGGLQAGWQAGRQYSRQNLGVT